MPTLALLPLPRPPGGLRRAARRLVAAALLLVTAGCSDGSGSPGPAGAQPGGPAPTPRETSGKPLAPVRNVILISLDTLRADRTEAYGYTRDTSPNLEALASRAVVFRNARAQSSQTAPSHATLFTSEHPGSHRIRNAHGDTTVVTQLPPGVRTLAEVAQEAGLDTAAFVTAGNLSRRMGMDRGFQTWDERPAEVKERIDAGVRWITEPGRGRFLLLIHTYETHAPYLPPRAVMEQFVDPAYGGPLLARTLHYLDLPLEEAWAAAVGPAYWEGMLDYTDADVRFLSDLYDAEIRHTDEQLRRFMEALAAAGRLVDTAVIVLSDHGEEFREHGKYQHDQMFEEHLRVPLILRLPPALEQAGMKGRSVAPVGLIDVAPTVVELLGIDGPPDTWDGRSLVDLMRAPAQVPAAAMDRPVFGELVIDPGPKFHRSVVWREWKYVHIWQVNIDHSWEHLYNLAEDPGERDNLAASTEAAATKALAALRRMLDEHSQAAAAKAARLGQGAEVELDAETREMLLRIGYMGDAAPDAGRSGGGQSGDPSGGKPDQGQR